MSPWEDMKEIERLLALLEVLCLFVVRALF